MGSAHGPDAAVRPDPAPDRPAPHPRGDDPPGLPDAQGPPAQGADARAHLRHARPHHPHDRPEPPPPPGAVAAIAFGIGTTQVRDILATQCVAMAKPKLRQVRVEGALARGVYAKDGILAIIRTLGVKGGVGYAYEYAGGVIDRMTME